MRAGREREEGGWPQRKAAQCPPSTAKTHNRSLEISITVMVGWSIAASLVQFFDRFRDPGKIGTCGKYSQLSREVQFSCQSQTASWGISNLLGVIALQILFSAALCTLLLKGPYDEECSFFFCGLN